MKVTSYTKEFLKAHSEALKNSLIEIGETIVSEAKALAPVDMGALRNSICYSIDREVYKHESGEKKITPSKKKTELLVGSALLDAPYQEFGTRYIAPNPYLRPAIALAKGAEAEIIMKKIAQDGALGPLQSQKRGNRIVND